MVFMNFSTLYSDDVNWFRVIKTDIQGRAEDGLIGFLPVTIRAVNLGFWFHLRLNIQANTIPLITDNAWLFKIENGLIIGLRLWWIGTILFLIIVGVVSIAALEANQ